MPSERDEFFVNYFPMPPRLGKFLGVLSGLILLFVIGLGFGLFLAQTPPANAGYQFPRVELQGVFQATPYPLVHLATTEATPTGGSVVLTGHPKFGIDPEAAAVLDGQSVRLGGVFLERDGVRLFQTRLGGNGLRLDAEPEVKLTVPEPEVLGMVELQGEIVDSKCFTGAMKPGDGKVHKGCASYCLLGGIPAYFITYHPDGGVTSYVLADSQGHALAAEWLRHYVADPVALSGQLERRGELLLLKADQDSLRRL